ncbi:MAG: ARMT1-like domain-containing protein [Candidatus Aenigmarchaeota archaeon]|nr:ARMT1-like domain-containing protein [Candidatus Aenigmarchaeota archaeon]
MRVSKDCYQCLERQVYQTAEFASSSEKIRAKAIEKGLGALKQNFLPYKTPTQVSGEVQRVIRAVTQCEDPYRKMKDEEMQIAIQLYEEIIPSYAQDFRSLVKLSVLGNTVDFFRDFTQVREDVKKEVYFTIDHVDRVEKKLANSKLILYLADNAGEVFFDLPLIKKIGVKKVIYVVKDKPVQDDLTIEDLKMTGLVSEVKAMTTGTDTPGIDFSLASGEFKAKFNSADLVIAKGMGHYETLSEEPIKDKIFYLLMAKCKPIASSLGVPLNSYVAMLQ